MIMRFYNGIVTASSLPKIELKNPPLPSKHSKVPIDRSQRYLRNLLADFGEDPLRCRV